MNGTSSITTNYSCSGSTDDQLAFFAVYNFWSGGVVNAIICLVGLAGNTISIPVLMSKAMDSVFNRLLVFLAIFDNLYLLLSLADCFRRHLGTVLIHKYAYGLALYGLHNAVMTCSIYMTVVLAFERHLAVSKPIEYHNAVHSEKRWVRLTRYVLPVVVCSVGFNLPKFFELRPKELIIVKTYESNDGNNYTTDYVRDVRANFPCIYHDVYIYLHTYTSRTVTRPTTHITTHTCVCGWQSPHRSFILPRGIYLMRFLFPSSACCNQPNFPLILYATYVHENCIKSDFRKATHSEYCIEMLSFL